jgi:uroporphyrin-III C-methyltransferase/precorrin-2 dehydrogenase/sirohydrochlorin ferrochelatase
VTENAYLVGLRLNARKVVVVGGGSVAQRRLPLLIATGAIVHVITKAATPAVEALASDGAITLVLREFRAADLADAWYVIAATDDPDVNAAIVVESERRRIFCVRADIPIGHPRGTSAGRHRGRSHRRRTRRRRTRWRWPR